MTRANVKVEIAFNAGYSTAASARTYTDITDKVLTANGINIGFGRQDERSQATPNTCNLTLDNSDGRFTPGLSSSPYYPNVKIGRPIRVCVQLLTAGDNGTFEANATGWTATNAPGARSTLQAHSGSAAFLMTSTTAADMSAQTASGTSGIPVAPNASYRASAWFRRGGAARTVDLRVDWYDAAGAVISTDVSSSITDSTTWQQINHSVTAPATAAYARVRGYWTAPAAAESHYIDDVRFDMDRYNGYVEEWPLEWPGVVSTFAVSQITCTSRMARLGLADPLRSILEEEVLRDSPAAYYMLAETDGATQAADSSDFAASPLVVVGDGAAITFGAEGGPSTDGDLTPAQFAGGKFLLSGDNRAFSGCAISCFVSSTASTGNVFKLFSGEQYVALTPFEAQAFMTAATATGDLNIDDGATHHVAVVVGAAGTDVYVDGSFFATIGGIPNATATRLEVGGDGFVGTVSHLAYFTTAPSAARIAAQAAAGLNGFSGETAQTRLNRYAAFAGIASAEYSFSASAATPMAHIDTSGQTPIALMQRVAETDGGVLYDGRRSMLTYKDRTVRYNASAVVTLDVNSGEVEANYAPILDRSALINKAVGNKSDGTYSATAENTTSSSDYGTANPGDLDLATTSNDEVHAATWWRVNTYGEPAARAPQLGVQIEPMTAARQALVMGASVSDKITVTNLYSQSDATTKSFFVEGYTETITDSRHRIEFNVSPTTGYDVFTVEDATYGQYDAYPLAY